MFKAMNAIELMETNGGGTKGVPVYKEGYIISWSYISSDSPIVEYWYMPGRNGYERVAFTYHRFRY